MNDIARKRGWTQKKWNNYKQWMHQTRGWLDWMVPDTESTMDEYEAVLAGYENRPPTIGADVPSGTPPGTPPVTTPAVAGTTEAPLPKGVTLTGERKFIGEDEYEKGSDGRWYKIKITPSVGGVAPTDLIMQAPGLYYSASSGEYWFEGEGGRIQTTEEFATSYLEQYKASTISPAAKAPSISEQQWEISRNRREWAPGVNIEQDITTGKLYRPKSMVEVSPDIATIELQQAQTVPKDWAGEQLALEKEKFAWQREEATKAKDPELQRQINELRWEKDRIQLLSGLPSDDWVSRYILENQPNPYKQPTPVNQVDQLEPTLDRQTANVQYQQKRLAEAITSGASADTIAEFQGYVTEAQKQRDSTYQAWSGAKKETRDWTPQPYPNAPEWLPQYAPGQVSGRMITPENVVTPSGQQLTQMSPSRAGQLGYFADWTKRMGKGRSWRDILAEAEIMQPYTPRGAGAARWSPARM